MKLQLSLLALTIGFGSFSFGQKALPSLQKLQDEHKVSTFKMSEERQTPKMIQLNAEGGQRFTSADAPNFLRQALNLKETTTLSKIKRNLSPQGLEVIKYQ